MIEARPARISILNVLDVRLRARGRLSLEVAGIDPEIPKGMRGGVVTAPSGRTKEDLLHTTEFLCCRHDGAADDVLAFRRVHLELFVPVDDGACLQQDGRHRSRFQYNELIVAIDTGFLVQE